MLVCDVDGVLTDGGLYFEPSGNVIKRFDVQDGLGIKLAQKADLQCAVITGLQSQAVRKRVRQLGIQEYFEGSRDKISALENLSYHYHLSFSQLAYLGDDWVDAPPMSRVGLPMAVANAQPEIKGMAQWVSQAIGGHGALREAISFILQAQGKLDSLWQQWRS
jgi:3-deoxy-D-manno-octulosonate 8-phosphate phosphatase (KDO 8-P phosphatase)